jgi:hypothetical protein
MSNIERDVARAPERLPFVIFIDINAPLELEAEGLDKQWMQDIKRWMDRMPAPTAEEPDVYNALYVTNFTPHYQGGGWRAAVNGRRSSRSTRGNRWSSTLGHDRPRTQQLPCACLRSGKAARSSSRGNFTPHFTPQIAIQAPAAVGLRNVRFCPSKSPPNGPLSDLGGLARLIGRT